MKRDSLECADLSALWYAATCRRKALEYGLYLAATSRGSESGNKLPHSKVAAAREKPHARYCFTANFSSGRIAGIPLC